MSSYSDATPDSLLTLLARDAYRHGEFTLSSGKKSNHYVNCKPVTLSGSGLVLISNALLEVVDDQAIAVGGLTLGADPLVSGVAMASTFSGRSLNALIVRKEPKGHGTGSCLEGPLPPQGSLVTVLEDVVTTGASSLKAVNLIRESGYLVQRVAGIVDRDEGATPLMRKAGLELISLFSLKQVAARADELGL